MAVPARMLGLLLCAAVAVSGSAVMPPPYDTIVIGLGSSGTTAATTLARHGKRVLALEAMDRIGGRVNTVPFGDGVVEVGAEWIHGTHPSRVYDLAVANNVSLMAQDLEMKVYRSDGTLADQALVAELVEYVLEVIEQVPSEPSDEPLGVYITKNLDKYLKEKHPEVLADEDYHTQLLAFLNLFMNNYEASSDWNEVSAWSKFKDLEGNQHMSWHRHGYKTFFDILLNRYNDGPGLPTLEIKLSTEVTNVKWPQDPNEKVAVITKDGAVYTADNVIVTVSLGVLKERHNELFSPQLPPEKVSAIENITMGLLNKVILNFPHKWWGSGVNFFIWRGKDLAKIGPEERWLSRIIGPSSPMGSSGVLTLWISGEPAKTIEKLSDDVVKTKAMELLRRFMGASVVVPEPVAMIRSFWFSNPFTRGSYTYDNLEVSKYPDARLDLAKPLTDSAGKPRVLFGGEATDETHFSTVHGASDAGYREAMRLLPNSSKI